MLILFFMLYNIFTNLIIIKFIIKKNKYLQTNFTILDKILFNFYLI
jgi:hypothetical protein